jgi:urease accessory protein UreF
VSVAVHMLVGMPRSGTSFLARALEAVPGVAVFGETDFFGRSYRSPSADGHYDRRALAAVIATQAQKEWTDTTGERGQPLARLAPGVYPKLVAAALDGLDRATPPAAFHAIAVAVAQHTGCDTVIEKTPGHLLFVERVAEALPEARFVASWREPAGFVRSFMQLDERDERAAARWLGRMSRHTALGVLMWRSYMRALERARACLGDRLFVISHEQLRRDPQGAVAQAAAHFGLDAPSVDLQRLPRNQSPNPHAATPADLRLWLRLLAEPFEADAELPRTTTPQALRSLITVGPSSALFVARVLPQAAGRLAYVRDYLGGGRGGGPS